MSKEDSNIIKETIKEYRKSRISKIWHDPVKAQTWGELGWFLSILLGFVLLVSFFYIDFNNSNPEEITPEIKNIIFSNMDCHSLRHTLIDLLDKDNTFEIVRYVELQIIARCNQ